MCPFTMRSLSNPAKDLSHVGPYPSVWGYPESGGLGVPRPLCWGFAIPNRLEMGESLQLIELSRINEIIDLNLVHNHFDSCLT